MRLPVVEHDGAIGKPSRPVDLGDVYLLGGDHEEVVVHVLQGEVAAADARHLTVGPQIEVFHLWLITAFLHQGETDAAGSALKRRAVVVDGIHIFDVPVLRKRRLGVGGGQVVESAAPLVVLEHHQSREHAGLDGHTVFRPVGRAGQFFGDGQHQGIVGGAFRPRDHGVEDALPAEHDGFGLGVGPVVEVHLPQEVELAVVQGLLGEGQLWLDVQDIVSVDGEIGAGGRRHHTDFIQFGIVVVAFVLIACRQAPQHCGAADDVNCLAHSRSPLFLQHCRRRR